MIGIPFVITNYFCGNKSFFTALNSHQCTSSTISVVCLAKKRTASGDFLSAKMRSTEKSVFLDDFLQTRGSCTGRTAIERLRKRAKKTPFRQLAIRNVFPKNSFVNCFQQKWAKGNRAPGKERRSLVRTAWAAGAPLSTAVSRHFPRLTGEFTCYPHQTKYLPERVGVFRFGTMQAGK